MQTRVEPSLDFLQGNVRQGAERDLEKTLTHGKEYAVSSSPSLEEKMLCWANSYVGLRAMTICN